jgi:hypothetical protein
MVKNQGGVVLYGLSSYYFVAVTQVIQINEQINELSRMHERSWSHKWNRIGQVSPRHFSLCLENLIST